MSKIYGDFSIRDHLFPFRTEKLSLIAQMVLGKTGRVCRRRPHEDKFLDFKASILIEAFFIYNLCL